MTPLVGGLDPSGRWLVALVASALWLTAGAWAVRAIWLRRGTSRRLEDEEAPPLEAPQLRRRGSGPRGVAAAGAGLGVTGAAVAFAELPLAIALAAGFDVGTLVWIALALRVLLVELFLPC